MQRVCTACKKTKPLTEFHKDPRGKFGTRARCKHCESENLRRWRAENREHFLTSQKEYRDANKDNSKAYREANKERDRITQKNWRIKNKDRKKENDRRWAEANKELRVAYIREWLKRNPGSRREYEKKWAQANRSRRRSSLAKRRALQKSASPQWLTAIHKARIQEHYDIATARAMQTGVEHHVDHIHPLQGENCCGLHVPWNLQVITASENLAKRNKILEAA